MQSLLILNIMLVTSGFTHQIGFAQRFDGQHNEPGDFGNRQIQNIQLMPLDQIEHQVERTGEDIKLDPVIHGGMVNLRQVRRTGDVRLQRRSGFFSLYRPLGHGAGDQISKLDA